MKFTSKLLVFTLLLLGFSQTGLAEGMKDQKVSLRELAPELPGPEMDFSKDKRGKKTRPLVDYDYEFMGTASVVQDAGSIQRVGGEKEDFSETNMEVRLLSGIILGNNFEPVFEIAYVNKAKTIGEYREIIGGLIWGLGVLFNVPLGEWPAKSRGLNAPLWTTSDWVPYGGFLIESISFNDEGGTKDKVTLAESEMRTKIIFGTRYLIYPHLALNLWLRLSYENINNEAKSSESHGGSLDRMAIDINLFSFSVLL